MLVLLATAALADPLDDLSPLPEVVLPPRTSLPAPPDAIINGAREPGYPSTVGLGFGGFTFCTGSLITPRIVLTAAHCSADFPIEVVVDFAVAYVGTDAAEPDAELLFSGGAIHPGYEPLVSGGTLGRNDVAVLFLAEDAPMDPVWFRTAPLRPAEAEDEDVISVGYGLDENQGANVKRSATLEIAALDPVFLVSNSSGNVDGANICSGDSGGPQYHVEADGTLVQWAVHSWGDLDCRYQSGSTRTDAVSDWILDQVEAEHGSRDRCVALRRYGDGVCDTDCDAFDPDCVEIPSLRVAGAEAPGGCSTVAGGGWLGILMGLGTLFRRGHRVTPSTSPSSTEKNG